MTELTREEKDKNIRLNETLLYEIGYDYSDQICKETDRLLDLYKDLEVPATLDGWFKRFSQGLKEKEAKAHKRKRHFRTMKYAASILVTLTVAASVITFNVEALRIKFFNLLISDEGEYTKIIPSPIDENDTESLNEKYAGSYYPIYMPEGFNLEKSHLGNVIELYHFERGEDFVTLTTSPLEASTTTLVDTEDAEVTYILINDYEAMHIYKKGTVKISFANEDTLFLLVSNLSSEEVIKIAENIKKIE
ncbi:DUF4367 domain-containing protein [Acidaminobacter sp. JC074]|uniref:DUF4367 domain-containing protein n=1 Tax=Acidaminobacter sp. JC074 TaxID=2530199 RepID=UPI001F0E22CD|nr:DUF4367 domain-containing protein [Acidaminobacter sp. JC074]